MKVWLVFLDGIVEYSSIDYYDAWDRYQDLKHGFGAHRTEFKLMLIGEEV